MVCGEGRLHGNFQSQRKHSDGKESEKAGRDEDVDTDIREEEEIGHDDYTDNVSQTAQFGDLNNLPCFLGENTEDDSAQSSHYDDHRACQSSNLVTVANTEIMGIL